MTTRNAVRIGILAALAAALLGSAPAAAQTSSATEFDGTAAASGTVSRTITDISEPNGPVVGPFGILRTQSTTVNVPITPGMTSAQIGTAFRDAINANGTLAAAGYSSSYTTPNATAKQNRPKMTRQVGRYSVIDGNTVPGVTMSPSAFTVQDAPVSTTPGLALLAAALAAMAWRERRRRTAV